MYVGEHEAPVAVSLSAVADAGYTGKHRAGAVVTADAE